MSEAAHSEAIKKVSSVRDKPQSAHTYTQARRHTALACFLPGFQLNSYAENEALKKKKKNTMTNQKSKLGSSFSTGTFSNIYQK